MRFRRAPEALRSGVEALRNSKDEAHIAQEANAYSNNTLSFALSFYHKTWFQPKRAVVEEEGEFRTRRRYQRLFRCARLSPALPAGETPAPERDEPPHREIESWAHEGDDMS